MNKEVYWCSLLERFDLLKWVIASMYHGDTLNCTFICNTITKLMNDDENDDDYDPNDRMHIFIEGNDMTKAIEKKIIDLLQNLPKDIINRLRKFYTTDDPPLNHTPLLCGHCQVVGKYVEIFPRGYFCSKECSEKYSGPAIDVNLEENAQTPGDDVVEYLISTFDALFRVYLKGFLIFREKGINMCIKVLVKYAHGKKGGRKIGSKLIERIKERLDDNGYIVAIASTCESAVQCAFYLKHQFQVVDMPLVDRALKLRDCLCYLIKFVKNNAIPKIKSTRPLHENLLYYMCLVNQSMYSQLVDELKTTGYSVMADLYNDLTAGKPIREAKINRFLNLDGLKNRDYSAAAARKRKQEFFIDHLLVSSSGIDPNLYSDAVVHVERKGVVPQKEDEERQQLEIEDDLLQYFPDVNDDEEKEEVEVEVVVSANKRKSEDHNDDRQNRCNARTQQMIAFYEEGIAHRLQEIAKMRVAIDLLKKDLA